MKNQMKKKMMSIGFVLGVMLTFSACGKPVDMLPEASSINWIDEYDKKNKTYGNEVVDAIIDKLDKKIDDYGEITGFYINYREDSKGDSNHSFIYVIFEAESEWAEVTIPYEVEVEYYKEQKEWKILHCKEDQYNDIEYTLKDEITPEIVMDTLQYEGIYLDYSYLYFNDVEFEDFLVESTEVEIDGDDIKCMCYCTTKAKIGDIEYELDLEWPIRLDVRTGEWYYSWSDEDDAYATIVSSNIDELLVDYEDPDILFNDLIENGYIGYDYQDINEDSVISYEFDSVDQYANYVYSYINVEVAGDEGITYDIQYELDYNMASSVYGYDEEPSVYTYSVETSVGDDFLGTIEGVVDEDGVTVIYTADGNTRYENEGTAKVRITFEECDSYGNITGTIEYTEDGTYTDYKPLEFDAYFDYYYAGDLYIYILGDSFPVFESSSFDIYWDFEREQWYYEDYFNDVLIYFERM